MKAWRIVCAGLAVAGAAPRSAAGEAKARPRVVKGAPPRLVGAGQGTRLEVDGAPFLMLGGELGNSTAGSLASAKAALAKLPRLGLNTVLVPVSWELVEPEEGKLDFDLVGGIVREARRQKLHLALLWFGSWKNGMSSYAPAWVKRDVERFPRVRRADGRAIESLSAFSTANRDADARTFAALLRYLRGLDEREHTVVLVQVENEVAIIDDARDRSEAAEAAYRSPVPRELSPPKSGSWAEVYGPGPATEERFMAWHFARYVDAVARAGKAEYPLPMFVNAALNRPSLHPGQYPSGGPLPHLLPIWKAGAPAIDLFAPDIYFPDVTTWCDRYRAGGTPLFIPEAENGETAAVNAFYALGQHALGFSPFAVEAMADPAAAALGRAYRLLGELAPVLLAPSADTSGVLLDRETPTAKLALGGYLVTVAHDYTFPWSSPARLGPTWPRAGALIVALADDEYLVAGNGVIVTFAPPAPGGPTPGLERVDEGRIDHGRFVPTRRLNGDETHQGRQVRLPYGDFGLQRVKLYPYR
jgi:hypothetical protein